MELGSAGRCPPHSEPVGGQAGWGRATAFLSSLPAWEGFSPDPLLTLPLILHTLMTAESVIKKCQVPCLHLPKMFGINIIYGEYLHKKHCQISVIMRELVRHGK